MSRATSNCGSPAASEVETASLLLSARQLAELLGVSLRKLERDRQDGTGVPYIKFGRRVLYRGADVEAYLEAQRFTSTAEARRAMEDR
jgi:excisionase family DNA binding protein